MQYSRPADRGEGLVIFADDKAFRVIFSDFGRISCNFRLDIRNFGKKCEIKGNKEKSRESGGSGQGKTAMEGWQVCYGHGMARHSSRVHAL